MALSEIDRALLQKCLSRAPRAWEGFVDRFLGLVLHVISHTAQSRSIRLSDADSEDLAADVFLAIIDDNFAVLRRFRGESSLATYLTVIARRVVVRQLLKRRSPGSLADAADRRAGQAADGNDSGNGDGAAGGATVSGGPTFAAQAVGSDAADSVAAHAVAANTVAVEERISNREEVERLLGGLNGSEAQVVRMYHLEGLSYQEISSQVGMPENSVGPTLSRARAKMRQAGGQFAGRD